MSITIPPDLVPLLRDGLFFDLHGELEKTGDLAASKPRGADVLLGIGQGLDRAEATRALLDIVGWIEPVDVPDPVVIEDERHRPALLRGLLERLGAERDAQEDGEASDAQRAQAAERAASLADVIQRAEETDLRPEIHHAEEGTEQLILEAVLTKRDGRTREELRALLDDIDPAAVTQALGDLEGEDVIYSDGERLHASECAQIVNRLVGTMTDRQAR